MGVEQRELLTAMKHIDGVVDVERQCVQRPFVAVHAQVHQRSSAGSPRADTVHSPGETGQLRTQIPIGVRQAAPGELERRIIAQTIEIRWARDGEDAGWRDAVMLARLHRAGALAEVWVADAASWSEPMRRR